MQPQVQQMQPQQPNQPIYVQPKKINIAQEGRIITPGQSVYSQQSSYSQPQYQPQPRMNSPNSQNPPISPRSYAPQTVQRSNQPYLISQQQPNTFNNTGNTGNVPGVMFSGINNFRYQGNPSQR